MAKPRKPTPNQAAFAKELERLQRQMRKLARQGFEFDFSMPRQPARVTQKQLEIIRHTEIERIYSPEEIGQEQKRIATLTISEPPRRPRVAMPEQKGIGRLKNQKHDEIEERIPRVKRAQNPYEPHPLTPEQRSEIAKQAWQTKAQRWREKGEYEERIQEMVDKMRAGLANITPEQRKTAAQKAAKTRWERLKQQPEKYSKEVERLKEQLKRGRERKQQTDFIDQWSQAEQDFYAPPPPEEELEQSYDIIIAQMRNAIEGMAANGVTRDTLSTIFEDGVSDDKAAVARSIQEHSDTQIKDAAFEADNPSDSTRAYNGAIYILQICGLDTPFNLEAIRVAVEADFQTKMADGKFVK